MSYYQFHVNAQITSDSVFKFLGNDTTNFVSFKVPALTGTANFVLPIADGTTGQCLMTDGSENLYFGTVTTATVPTILYSKSIVIDTPSNDADYAAWRVPYAITISAVHILVQAGVATNVVGFVDIYSNNGLSVSATSGDATVNAYTNNTTTVFSTSNVPADTYLGWHTTSTGAGGVDSVTITIDYTRD